MYTILWFYFQVLLCCVQNLIHYTLPDSTGIFDSVLNITSNTNTATTTSNRLIKVCTHMLNTVYTTYTCMQCGGSTNTNWTFWQTERIQVRGNTATSVFAPQSHKVWLVHYQILRNIFQMDLMLHTPHYWLTYQWIHTCLSSWQTPTNHCPLTR